MRIYTVHYRPGSVEPDAEALLVREGFAWLAFIFAPLWALWHRLWLVFVLVASAGIALDIGLDLAGADPATVLVCGLGLALFIGFGANDWRRARLARVGYALAGVVAARDKDTALRRFFDLNPDFGARPPRDGRAALGGL